jgi:hypothetical protein
MNDLLNVQLDGMRISNSLCGFHFSAAIFHPIGLKFWIQLTKTYLSWTTKPDFKVSIRVEWYLGKSSCKLEKIMLKVKDIGLYHETCLKENKLFSTH